MASNEDKAYEKARADANNADNVRNAAKVAQQVDHPYAKIAGTAVLAADKLTGGKSTELLGKSVTQSVKMSPGGKYAQQALNKLNESGLGDKVGQAASQGKGPESAMPNTSKSLAEGKGVPGYSSSQAANSPKGGSKPSTSGKSSPGGQQKSGAERQQEAANKKDLSNKVSNAKNSDQENNQKDVDAIKNRQTNQADHNSAYRPASADREREAEQKMQQSQNAAGAGAGAATSQAKDATPSNDEGLKDKNDVANDAKNDIEDAKNNEEEGLLSKKQVYKFIKRRILTFVIITTSLIIIPILIIALYVTIVDNMIGAISSFFGISEADTKEGLSIEDADGLLTNPKYQFDPETGLDYTREELVTKLKADNDCKSNVVTNIRDWFDGWDGNLSTVCANIRHIQKYEEKREKEIRAKGIEITLDRGLILAAVFYGFTKQPEYNDYVDPENVEEMVPAVEHFATLKNIINEGDILNVEDLDDLIENSILDGSYDYYNFDGVCVKEHVDVYYYSSDKWKIMMRFGENVANEYQKVIQNNAAIEATDAECRYKLRVQTPKDESTFLVHADIESEKVDKFNPAEGLDGDVPLAYKNGYAYTKFPYYEKSINDPQINLSYDEIITPKDIESAIVYLFTKKETMNEILFFEDQDEKYKAQLGPYVYSAYCGKYLTAPIDTITVKVTDCDGNYIRSTTFKDYIMGVAYGEVSDSGDNYVKSEMVAAISYALRRRNNYNKGDHITMRSGNCDQVYCSMYDGCYSKKANISCGGFNCTSYLPGGGSYHRAASTALIQKYSDYYDEAADYLVVRDNKPFSAHYVSKTQKRWKEKSDAGMHYSQIISEEYAKEGAAVVRCSEDPNSNSTTTNETKQSTPSGGNTR